MNNLTKTVAVALVSSIVAFGVYAAVAIKKRKQNAAKAEIDGEETKARIE